jgi:hypothetical protein
MKDNYGKQEMGKSTQMDIDRMARQGGQNEVRASEDYNRMMMKQQAKPMTRMTPRKSKR